MRPTRETLRAARFPRRSPSAFTLLEVVLALALAGALLATLATAIYLHLNVIGTTRTGIEEAQLARTVLRRISDDLRGAIRLPEKSDAGLAGLLSASANAAASQATGGSGGSASSTGGSGSGAASSGNRASGGGQATGSQGAGGGRTPGNTQSGSGGATSSGGRSTSTSAASGSGGSQTSSEAADSDVVINSVAGVYGNQYELQVDMGRLPRWDEFGGVAQAADGTPVASPPHDVRTVSYFVAGAAGSSITAGGPAAGAAVSSGLMRREIQRAAGLWAAEQGDLDAYQTTDSLLAPEVAAVEFAYFNGTEWLSEWDSEELGGLPMAIDVRIMLATDAATRNPASATSAARSETGTTMYRLLVHLPNAEPTALEDSTATDEMEEP